MNILRDKIILQAATGVFLPPVTFQASQKGSFHLIKNRNQFPIFKREFNHALLIAFRGHVHIKQIGLGI
ncbi:Uncharacterised protein [Mycobacteroides abscessus]|nr:Uncharacterised protein [Mycobacteroides abscessus]